MKETIKKSFIAGLVFTLTSLTIGITYATISHVTGGTTLTADKFNEIIDATAPSGAVMAFYLSACPTGWIAADGTNSTPDLRGTFIRGDNGEVNGRDVLRSLGEYQADSFASHNHGIDYNLVSGAGGGSNTLQGPLTQASITYTRTTGGTETRPKNVTLLYCMKQ